MPTPEEQLGAIALATTALVDVTALKRTELAAAVSTVNSGAAAVATAATLVSQDRVAVSNAAAAVSVQKTAVDTAKTAVDAAAATTTSARSEVVSKAADVATNTALSLAAKTSAEAARDAVNSTGKVFTAAEHTAGTSISSTTTGQQFAVLAADLKSYAIWRNNAGTALALNAAMYTKAYLDSIVDGGYYNRAGVSWGVMGANGRLPLWIDLAGKVTIGNVSDVAAKLAFSYTAALTLNPIAAAVIPGYYSRSAKGFVVVDANNKKSLWQDDAGNLISKDVNLTTSASSQNSAISALQALMTQVAKYAYSSKTVISLFGDSMTAGTGSETSEGGQGGALTYGGRLATLSGRTIRNFGIGGQTPTQIFGRIGVVDNLLTAASNQIPASGPVAITTPASNFLGGGNGSASVPGWLAGIEGVLSYTSGGGYVFTRSAPGDSVPCPAGTKFYVTDAYDYDLQVIWTGRNGFNVENSAANYANLVQSILDNTAKAVGKLKVMDKRFIILGVLSGDNAFEYINATGTHGTANYTAKRNLANALRELYPRSFVDIDMIARAAATSSTQDLLDISRGISPTSLRKVGDNQHQNDAGQGVTANAVWARIQQNGW